MIVQFATCKVREHAKARSFRHMLCNVPRAMRASKAERTPVLQRMPTPLHLSPPKIRSSLSHKASAPMHLLRAQSPSHDSGAKVFTRRCHPENREKDQLPRSFNANERSHSP